MESYSEDMIIIVLGKIMPFLEEYSKPWAEVMKNLLDNYIHLTHSSTKKEAAILIRRSMQGGMGSLMDLVLHKDGKPLIEENNQLEELKGDLYDACEAVIYGALSARKADVFINSEYTIYEFDVDNYVVYRAASAERPLGQFFVWDKTAAVLSGEQTGINKQIYLMKIPKGTVARMGEVITPYSDNPIQQLYFDKPWKIHGFEIVPLGA